MNRKDFLLATLGMVGVSVLGGGCDGGGGGTGGTGGTAGHGGEGHGGHGGTGGAGGTGGTGGSGGSMGGAGGTGGSMGGSGGSMGGAGGSSADCTSGTSVTIGGNHGHMLVVSADDVAAAMDKTYDIQGGSMHPHTVTVTAADFAMLAAGSTLMITSSMDAGHTHSVTIVCG